jgi:GDSL-like lipase/acylhydrolase family protein
VRSGLGRRLAALFAGVVFGLLAAELLLRLGARTLQLDSFSGFEDAQDNPIYRASATRGYEPIPGEGGYNEYGVLDYGYILPRRERLLRLLVLGDSVTHRRLWVEALERRLQVMIGPGGKVEAWNAGVEGYNTVQEEVYLRELGVEVRADLVVVQFHLNDFLPLPVLFRDHDGQVAYLPFESDLGSVCQPLFQFSYLYRYILLRWRPTHQARNEAARRQIDRAVAGIQDLCRQHGLDLVFVIFPLFKPRADYDETERLWHRWILEILRDHHIDSVDLHAVFPAGPEILALRERSDDPWHPNLEGHRMAAQAVFQLVRYRPVVRRAEREALRASHQVPLG